jgi:hypothetical protein
MCAEEIPLAAATCEFCGAQFEVTSTGYCQTCHDVRDADGNGQCKVCGNQVMDLRVESKLIEESAQEPLSISPPIAQTEVTSTGKSRLPIGILAGILIFAVIGAFLWFGRNSLPVVSNLFATKTPTAKATFTPTLISTVTPTSTLTPTPTATPDPRIYNIVNRHYYLYVEQRLKWKNASDYCQKSGGYLATIQDDAENRFLYKLTYGDAWLGATDRDKEGTWVWVSGETWKYTNWDKSEPNNYKTENYLSYSEHPYFWNDRGDGYMNFVCEWESISP